MDAKKIIELKQERAKLTEDIRAVLDKYEGEALPEDKKEEIDKMEARFDEVTNIVSREEAQLNRERIVGEKAEEAKPEKRDDLMSAFTDYIRSGSEQSMEVYAALQQANPTQAGYLVAPEKFVREIIKDLADKTFMRQKAKVLEPLQGAQSLGYPTRTAGMSSFAWGTEISTPTEDSTLAYGKREFKPIPGTSEIRISKTLVRNVPNADSLVRDEISEDVGGNLEDAYMNGTGANQPLGVFTASNDGISTSRDVSTGNTATEIKFDGLMEAKYAIKEQYRRQAEWIFHRDGIKKIAKLKDSNGQYIWQPSVQQGAPDMLLGHVVNESEYAPNTFTTGLYVGLFGDLKQYWICDSLAMEIQVLVELYARYNQLDYITRIETDGAPVLPNAFSRVKLA